MNFTTYTADILNVKKNGPYKMTIENFCVLSLRVLASGVDSLDMSDLKTYLAMQIHPISKYVLLNTIPGICHPIEHQLPAWFIQKMQVLNPVTFMGYAINTAMYIANLQNFDERKEQFVKWSADLFPQTTADVAIEMSYIQLIADCIPNHFAIQYIRGFHKCLFKEHLDLIRTLWSNVDGVHMETPLIPLQAIPRRHVSCYSTKCCKCFETLSNVVPHTGDIICPQCFATSDDLDDELGRIHDPLRFGNVTGCHSIRLVTVTNPVDTAVMWKLVKSFSLDDLKIPTTVIDAMRKTKAVLSGGACVRMYYDKPFEGDFDLYMRYDKDRLISADDLFLKDGYARHNVTNTENISACSYGPLKIVRYRQVDVNKSGNIYIGTNLPTYPHFAKHFQRIDDGRFYAASHHVTCDLEKHFKMMKIASEVTDGDFVPRGLELPNFMCCVRECSSFDIRVTAFAKKQPRETIIGNSKGVASKGTASKPNPVSVDLIVVDDRHPRDFIQQEFDINVCKMYGEIEDNCLNLYALYPEDLDARVIRYAFDPRITVNVMKQNAMPSRIAKYIANYDLTPVAGSGFEIETMRRAYAPMPKPMSDFRPSPYMPFRYIMEYANIYNTILINRLRAPDMFKTLADNVMDSRKSQQRRQIPLNRVPLITYLSDEESKLLDCARDTFAESAKAIEELHLTATVDIKM